MAILDEILVWTQTLPEWQQDASRHLFQKPDGLSKQDYDELYSLLKSYHQIPGVTAVASVPLSKGHIHSSTDNTPVTLKAMYDLKHVNCIAPDQKLEFEPTGMTIIYGGNGSGKSGYARVLKRACRARDQKEIILPNANDPSEQGSVPKATFDIEIDSSPCEIKWSSDSTPPDELASISVFDAHCARVVGTPYN